MSGYMGWREWSHLCRVAEKRLEEEQVLPCWAGVEDNLFPGWRADSLIDQDRPLRSGSDMGSIRSVASFLGLRFQSIKVMGPSEQVTNINMEGFD